MKIFAMYLPQFHRVKENDEWWGEGFTDWITTKNAEKLFEGHYQPHVPLNKNYYDLADISSLKWQESLLKRYDVDGLCIYHYWFENGRKILEKPAELILKNKDIDIPFCFSWANETWARSWGNIENANTWSTMYEHEGNNNSAILIRQEYGNIEEWKRHFMYLLPFFLDDRYIKIGNRPVMNIYKARLIPCLEEMLDCWKDMAKANGFDGMYIIGSDCDKSTVSYVDKVLVKEPWSSINALYNLNMKDGVRVNSYDDLWQVILTSEDKENYLYGGFVSYDETPRRGRGGTIVEGSTPKKFGNYLTKLLAKNHINGNELVFVNAWNEWGEGNHLEPDESFGYGYLEQIKVAKDNYLSVNNDEICKVDCKDCLTVKRLSKYEQYYKDMDIWMNIRERGVSLLKYLDEQGISTFAIYGCGAMGKHFLMECVQKNRECKYFIDVQKNRRSALIPIYSPDEALPEVDAVIVSAYFYYEEINKKIPYKCISLGEIINSVYIKLQ